MSRAPLSCGRPLVAVLFVPATRPDRFAKAAASGADAVIVDLEDAVPPSDKEDARANLGAVTALAIPAFVRVNAMGTPWYEADLSAFEAQGANLLCLPKVESMAELDAVASRLGDSVRILAQIETAAGLANAAAIASHGAVVQLAFGPADFFLDMDMNPSPQMSGHALRLLAVASRAAAKPLPLDGPCFSVGDAATLDAECQAARLSGAGGKFCIHPSQPIAVLERFSPSSDEMDWAARVVSADREGGAQLIDGRMIDAPIVARARAVLERASAGAAPAEQGR